LNQIGAGKTKRNCEFNRAGRPVQNPAGVENKKARSFWLQAFDSN
jgi:hypothetical protein